MQDEQERPHAQMPRFTAMYWLCTATRMTVWFFCTHPLLASRHWWMICVLFRGIRRLARGDHERALPLLSRFVAYKAGRTEILVAITYGYMAECYTQLGDREAAQSARAEAKRIRNALDL